MERSSVVLWTERHLKWRALDRVEGVLMWLCGLVLATFTATVLLDVSARLAGSPVPWMQEATLGAFVWGVFLGAAVAVRRNQHFVLSRLSARLGGRAGLAVGVANILVLMVTSGTLVYFGFIFLLRSFGVLSQPSGTPYAVITAAIPVSGILIFIFSMERLVNCLCKGVNGDRRDSVEDSLVAEGATE